MACPKKNVSGLSPSHSIERFNSSAYFIKIESFFQHQRVGILIDIDNKLS
jgi:hypothetical protein